MVRWSDGEGYVVASWGLYWAIAELVSFLVYRRDILSKSPESETTTVPVAFN